MPNIKVVCATRRTTDEFLRDTPTGKSIVKMLNCRSDLQFRLFPGNSLGLPLRYNQAIEESRAFNGVLAFLHDDIWIQDFYWVESLIESLGIFDLVGVVGNTSRRPFQPGWIIKDRHSLALDDIANLSGAVGQGNPITGWKYDYFGPSGRECKLVDGLLLASHAKTFFDKGIRFDERFAFHHYDMDICRSFEAANLRIGTSKISLIHESPGAISPAWKASCATYFEKWGD